MDHNSLEKKASTDSHGHEKAAPIHEDHPAAAVDAESQDTDPAFAKRTMRLIDLRVLPILAALYALSLIDRTNTSNAYVAGMAKDLGLTIGTRYSIITVIFFVPYIIFELPSNIVVRRVGAAPWLGTIALLWGSVMLGMGFVKHWWQLAICRALLGLLEAGFFPACAYLISTWYIRREVQKRMTGFYMLSVVVGGFSSAIAGGISEMRGTRGLNGWRWIFILEGVVTVAIALLAYLLVVDFPDKNKFLTTEQTRWVLARLDNDRGDIEADAWTWKKFWSYMLTPKLWAFGVLFGSATTCSYAFAYFLPIIMVGLGYSELNAQLLCAPPYFTSIFLAFGLAWVGDKYIIRAPIIMVQAVLTIIGLSMTAFHPTPSVRYGGVFLGLAGANANVASILGYMQNNIVGHTKRSFTSALVIGAGGVGGIVASTVFQSKDAPKYRPGLWVTIGANFVILLVSGIMTAYFMWRNRQVRAGRGKPIEGKVGFYYTI
ncbi:MFS general substrate transporter [Serendipita vermifera]|nr:MFS general substrate transporter [Serendipita vermifera]